MLIAAAGVEAAYAGFGALVLGKPDRARLRAPVRDVGDRTPPSLRAVREGLAYVRRSPIVLGCMALDMFAVIFAGATALLPVYATEILAVGSARLRPALLLARDRRARDGCSSC
jgi:hypothetical protein